MCMMWSSPMFFLMTVFKSWSDLFTWRKKITRNSSTIVYFRELIFFFLVLPGRLFHSSNSSHFLPYSGHPFLSKANSLYKNYSYLIWVIPFGNFSFVDWSRFSRFLSERAIFWRLKMSFSRYKDFEMGSSKKKPYWVKGIWGCRKFKRRVFRSTYVN